MEILGKLATTFALMFGVLVLYFPGGFGVLHFRVGRSKLVSRFASTLWAVFMLTHLVAVYRVWFSEDRPYVWVLSLLLGHIVFFKTIARDVSTK